LGKNQKQALQLLIIVLGFVTLGAWVATLGHPAVLAALRYGAPAAAVYAGWELFRAGRRPGKVPDDLAGVAPKYFGRDGVCLAPVFETAGGAASLCVYFQNRYAGPATARFVMLPPRRTMWFGRHPLPRVSVDFECPGGAFGVVRLPFAVPAKYQGRRLAFDVGADVAYPAGKGELLRYREGKHLVATNQLDREYHALAALLLGGLGILIAALALTVSRAKLRLPTDVAETGPETVTGRVEILSPANPVPTGAPAARKAA
jgi:hypothetical protein